MFYITPATADAKRTSDGFTAAALALGWQPTVLTFPSNPADTVGLVLQAIQQGADYVSYLGTDTAIMQPAIDAARAANVPLFANATNAVPGGVSELDLCERQPVHRVCEPRKRRS